MKQFKLRAAALAVLMGSGMAMAADSVNKFPTKPVRIIVGYPAGGGVDMAARLVGQGLGEEWKSTVVIDNRPGAAGGIGTELTARAPADGYTLMLCNIGTHGITPARVAKLPYDPIKDFSFLSRIGGNPNVLMAHASLPARNIQELIAYAKANPGKLSYGTSAAGTSAQLAMELLKLTTKIDVVHVAYKGAPQALSDTMGGQIPSSMQTAPAVLPTIQSGRVRALALTSLKRIAHLPAVPTLHETVLPGFEADSWYGLCAPAGTPAPILDKVHADLTAVLRTPEIQQRFNELVIDTAPNSREEFARFIRADAARWARVIKEAGIAQQ